MTKHMGKFPPKSSKLLEIDPVIIVGEEILEGIAAPGFRWRPL